MEKAKMGHAKIMNCIKIFFCSFFVLFFSSNVLAASKLSTYYNKEYGFSFKYPSDWRAESPSSQQVVVKLVSENGTGTEIFNVVLQKQASLKNVTTADAVKMMTPRMTENQLRNGGLTDARIEDSGITEIYNRKAFYSITSYTIRTAGFALPVKTLTLVTTKKDLVYTITCGTIQPDRFNKIYPTCRLITGTFFIEP